MSAKQLFKLNLECAEIEQRCTRQRIDQNVNVARLVLCASRDGAEYTKIVSSVSLGGRNHRNTLVTKRFPKGMVLRVHLRTIAQHVATAQTVLRT
jgi:hypothetical protein